MIGLLRLGLIGVGGFLYATSLTGAYAAECAVPLDCYTKSLQQLQLAKDIVAKPLDALIALRKKNDDLEGKLQTEENSRKAAVSRSLASPRRGKTRSPISLTASKSRVVEVMHTSSARYRSSSELRKASGVGMGSMHASPSAMITPY